MSPRSAWPDDVFTTEPLPRDHPLWSLDNAVITPHISGPNLPEEIAPVFKDRRAFQQPGAFTLPENTCFIVTDAGVAYIRALADESTP